MHLVMIGGSDAGISAALRARELDPAADVTVVLEDAYPNFSICGIPYYVSGEVTHWRNLAHRTLADLEAAGMRLRTDTTARRIDVPGGNRDFPAYLDSNRFLSNLPGTTILFPVVDLSRSRTIPRPQRAKSPGWPKPESTVTLPSPNASAETGSAATAAATAVITPQVIQGFARMPPSDF